MNTANRVTKITYTIKRMTLISGFRDIIQQLLSITIIIIEMYCKYCRPYIIMHINEEI